MPRKRKAQKFKIRSPKQPRAHDTVEAIFDATIHILEKEARSSFNTNRIAKRAGICIGTLYQYFPNKEAILKALSQRTSERMRNEVAKRLEETRNDPYVQRERLVINAVLKVRGTQHKLRRAILENYMGQGNAAELVKPIEEIARMLRSDGEYPLRGPEKPMSPLHLFVVTRAISGIMREATIEGSPFMDSPEFEGELVRLAQGYLALI